jgi:hypothetical protein
MEVEAFSRSEGGCPALAEDPEALEFQAAAREWAAVLLGSEVAPQFLLELSLLLLCEGLFVCAFLLRITIALAAAAPAAKSSESACPSVSAPWAPAPAASSTLLALLARFSNGGSIGHWTFRKLCSFSAHFKHTNDVTIVHSRSLKIRARH